MSTEPIDILFFGCSRVAAALDADTLRDGLPNGPALRIINAGVGYTTSAEYYLALRNTLALHASRLRDCTVLVEVFCPLHDSSTWSDPWSYWERPDILTPFLRAEDIAPYWRGPHPFEDKLKLTFDWLLQPWATYSRARVVGGQYSALPQKYLGPLLEKILLPPVSATPAESALTHAGGIRADEQAIVRTRIAFTKYVGEQLRDQKPIDWPGTITADIARLARAYHLQLIFFATPQHSLLASLSETSTRRHDRANFHALCQEWGTPLLVPDFPTTEEDFPDIIHLRRAQAPACTKALLNAWPGLPKHSKPQ